MPIRFHLDENVSHEIARGLRSRGIDVSTAGDAGLLEGSDEDHIAFAVSEGRVVFTQDADFLRLAASGIEHAGIVYCRQQARTPRQIIAYLALMHACLEPEEMRGKVDFVQEAP